MTRGPENPVKVPRYSCSSLLESFIQTGFRFLRLYLAIKFCEFKMILIKSPSPTWRYWMSYTCKFILLWKKVQNLLCTLNLSFSACGSICSKSLNFHIILETSIYFDKWSVDNMIWATTYFWLKDVPLLFSCIQLSLW